MNDVAQPAAAVLADRSPGPTATPLRASDAEREAVAARLRSAAGDGLLTLAEADERQACAYAARTRDDLVGLTADLPPPPPPPAPRPGARGPLTERARRRLLVHAAIVAGITAMLVARWTLGPAMWFPGWPLMWLALSLVVHHRRAERRPVPDLAAVSR